MKRRLEFLKNAGVVLMELHRLEGTDKLVFLIVDFGHDYRNSLWAVRPKHAAEILAHIHEREFAENVERFRERFADEIPVKRLDYDDTAKCYLVVDEDAAPDTHVT